MKTELFLRIILGLFIFTVKSIQGQNNFYTDSLEARVKSINDTEEKVLTYILLGQAYEGQDLHKAKQLYLQARDLSKKIGFTLGEIKFIANYTYALNQEGDFDSSLYLNLKAIALSQKIGDSLYMGKSALNTGTSYKFKGDFVKATEYYEMGYRLFEKFGDPALIAQADDILISLYVDLHQYDKAVDKGLRATAFFKKTGNDAYLAYAESNLGMAYMYQKNYELAQKHFEESLRLFITTDNQTMLSSIYLNLSNLFLQQRKFDEMKPFTEKALMLAKEQQLTENMIIALRSLAIFELYNQNFNRANEYAIESLHLTQNGDFKLQRQKIYQLLSDIAYAQNKVTKGLDYDNLYEQLSDSIYNENIQNATLELNKKYETSKKNEQIALQQEKIQKNRSLISILLITLGLFVLSGLLYYKFLRQKTINQKQRIEALETENRLSSTAMVLKGEERERTRLAKDLHDGLGGLLSGIKFSLHNMKENLIMTPEVSKNFERSIDMLDSSIQELRRVAHNLMPESLLKYGLDTALRDFCSEINAIGQVNVDYQSYEVDNMKIEQTKSIAVYRIAQELINNALKHAVAKNIVVQLSFTGDLLSLTVEDDGKGMQIQEALKKEGMGLRNIQNRVDFIEGHLDIESNPHEGTSIHIEIPIA